MKWKECWKRWKNLSFRIVVLLFTFKLPTRHSFNEKNKVGVSWLGRIFPNLINNRFCLLNVELKFWVHFAQTSCACDELWIHKIGIEFVFIFNALRFLIFSLVQGSHRDSTKQNKDLATLTQQHPSSNNLNNPSSLSANKNPTPTDADVNRSGPYFDVAASKNVRFSLLLFLGYIADSGINIILLFIQMKHKSKPANPRNSKLEILI